MNGDTKPEPNLNNDLDFDNFRPDQLEPNEHENLPKTESTAENIASPKGDFEMPKHKAEEFTEVLSVWTVRTGSVEQHFEK